jgi:hypothetical protein
MRPSPDSCTEPKMDRDGEARAIASPEHCEVTSLLAPYDETSPLENSHHLTSAEGGEFLRHAMESHEPDS